MGRRSVAGMILAAWVGSLAWLAGRELRHDGGGVGGVEDVSRNIPPSSMFYELSVADRQVGFASTTVDTVPDGLVTDDRLIMEIPVLGRVDHTQARAVAYFSRSLELSNFQTSLQNEAGTFVVVGTVAEDSLSIEFGYDETRQQLRLPLDNRTVHQVSLPLRLPVGTRLESGAEHSFGTIDQLSFQDRDVSVRVLAESTLIVPDSASLDSSSGLWVPARWDTLHAWKIEQHIGDLALQGWIDDYGVLVQATSPTGFEVSRTAFEIAFYNLRSAAAAAGPSQSDSDVIHRTAIASNATLPLVELTELKVRLGGVDLSGFDLEGARQSVSGDTLIIRTVPEDVLQRTYRLPHRGAYTSHLEPEPFIQSNDPRVQAQARQIVGRRPRAARAARMLTEWVHQQLEKEATVGIPNALHALNTRRGDCNEHTALFVALARAIGLPARTAAGLVYVDGRFYYHAWPEVYLTDWVPVDPTFGQFPADATHLRLTVGGLARQLELIHSIGRLTLNVERVEE